MNKLGRFSSFAGKIVIEKYKTKPLGGACPFVCLWEAGLTLDFHQSSPLPKGIL